MKTHAFTDPFSNLSSSKGNSYLSTEEIIKKLEHSLSLIEFKGGYYVHKNLDLKDTDGKQHSYDEMPENIKQKISGFVEVQRNSILDLIYKLKQESYYKIGRNIIHNIPSTNNGPIQHVVSKAKSMFPDGIVPPENNLLEDDEVCQFLKTTKRTLKSYRDSGLLPFIVIKNRIYYYANDIHNFKNPNKIVTG